MHPKTSEVSLQCFDLVLGNSANQMRLHILRFWLWGVVYIASDVEVVIVVIDDFLVIDQAAVFREFPLMGEDEIDLLDVLRTQFILVLALGEFSVDYLICASNASTSSASVWKNSAIR